jgi:hypothetical protein
MGIVLTIIYVTIGGSLANHMEYTDGLKGIQAPARFFVLTAAWPLLVLYCLKCLADGTATFRRKG